MQDIKINSSFNSQDKQSVGRYLNEISKIPLLTVQEEVELSKKISDGDASAVDRLVRANLRFVVLVAKKYQNRGLNLEDLINEGNIGLIKAAKKFDHTKGFKFISFAVWWIRQMIILSINEQSRVIRLPLNLINSISLMHKVIANSEQCLGRLPTQSEIANEIENGDIRINNYKKTAFRWACYDDDGSDPASISLIDILPGSSLLDDEQFKKVDNEFDVAQMLKVLSVRDQRILKLYFGLDGEEQHSLEDIALCNNLSIERVRQLKDQSLRLLRKKLKK